MVETWDSYAILNSPGKSFGPCVFDGPVPTTPSIRLKWKKRFNNYGNYEDTYALTFTAPKVLGNVAFNLSFSHYAFASKVKGADRIEQGTRPDELFLQWDGVDLATGDVLEKDITWTYAFDLKQDHCIYDATFDETIDKLSKAPSTLDSDFDPTTQLFLFDSKVTYHCGLGRAFLQEDGSTQLIQEFQCDWNAVWTPTNELKSCIWTHCLQPYPAPNETRLEPSAWDGQLIGFEQKISYTCMRKMKFKDNFSQKDVKATCKPENTWDLPGDWGTCVDTRFCPTPPQPPEGGTVTVEHSGLRFGTICPGSNGFELLNLLGCSDHNVRVSYETDLLGEDKIKGTYSFMLDKGSGGALFLLLQFSQPLSDFEIDLPPGMQMVQAVGQNDLIILMELESDSPLIQTNVVLKFAKDGFEPCLLGGACENIQSEQLNQSITKFTQEETLNLRNITAYASLLKYQCSLAKEFLMNEVSGETSLHIEKTCTWDQAWSPNDQIPPCVCKSQTVYVIVVT